MLTGGYANLAHHRLALLLAFSKHGGFEFVHCGSFPFDVRIGVHLHADADAMPPLIGGHLRIDAVFLDRLAFVFRRTWNVAQPKPIFSSSGSMSRRQRLSADMGVASASREYETPRARVLRKISPLLQQHGRPVGEPYLSILPVFWRVEDAFVDALLYA